MMKRNLALTIIIFTIFLMLHNKTPTEVMSHEVMIPDEAIRLRILAHNDETEEQQIKYAVRDEISAYISHLVAHVTTIDDARTLIHNHLPQINNLDKRTSENKSRKYDYEIGRASCRERV